ncbi:MAG: hypothetical protein IJB43_07205 [Clostridia bacterium]|nr:hypothetical protein [Clostridia bacterium]
MTYEVKKIIKTDLCDRVLRKGESVTYTFTDEGLNLRDHHRLYFSCEDRMHFALKDEVQTLKLYQLIDDSLDNEHANTRRYCLNMTCDAPKLYPKCALTKIKWPPRIDSVMYDTTDEWTFGIFAKAESLKIAEGGYLRIQLERWNKKPGIPPELTRDEPDEIVSIDIPEGTYDYTALMKQITLPTATTACVTVIVEGQNYEGTLYLEEPTLATSTGRNVCPDFATTVPNLDYFTWIGQNLSKKEWPEFIITLNDQVIHHGEVFLRIHRYPSVELDIPDCAIVKGENTVKIQYVSNYRDTVPLSLRELEILERPKKLFSITSCPVNAAFGQDICVLIRTEEDGLTLNCDCDNFEAVSSLHFGKKGIHAARFRAKKCLNHQILTLKCGDFSDSAEIRHLVRRGEDNVITGSADLIYIDNSDPKAVEDYIEWFFSKEMGDLITIRPAYRWGGQRTLNPEVWEKFREICEGMDAKYAHMVDGRDLPGVWCNPHPDMLKGKNFMGRQLHERDGQAFYWSPNLFTTMNISPTFWSLSGRISRQHPLTTENSPSAHNIALSGGQLTIFRDTNCSADVKEAYECAQNTLRTVRGGDRLQNVRHTGPSVMFKYLYDAGFEWLGAETMDSSMEPLLAFHRGSARAYGQKELGVHQALQWSTFPHDTEPRYRRYLLALYTCYLQGVHQINLEEGYWHLESGFVNHHRFSDATTRHRESEVKFYRFIRSHTRSGEFYTPIAILHGRYDGWNGFAGGSLWGMPHMRVSEPEKSWSLLKVFYPLSNISEKGTTVPKLPAAIEDNRPRGMYTGTPRGHVDVMPIEKGIYDGYKLLAFLGHNTADRDDFDRVYGFVKKGGTLLTTWAHLSSATRLDDIQNHNFKYLYHSLSAALTTAKPIFETRNCNGKKLPIAVNPPADVEVLEKTDDGMPFVYSVKVGEGRVILVNTIYHPANDAVRSIYEKLLRNLQAKLYAEEPSEMTCGEDVQYAIYKQENGDYHYYVTPVDWYNDPAPKRSATLRVGEDVYPLSLTFGDIIKIVANNTTAAWAEEMDAEVLSIEGDRVTVQGVDTVTLHICRGGKEHVYKLDCTTEPVAFIAQE